MNSRWTEMRVFQGASRRRLGFTLVELLTVVAIIMLLIGILIPTLSRAREHAKATATKAILKGVGDGLEMFRNENPEECRGGDGYPSSAMRDDPTEPNEQWIFGAQWLVRYLIGKPDLTLIDKTVFGYVPRRNVPRAVLALGGTQFFEEEYWYDIDNTSNPHAPLQRVGPYLPLENVMMEMPENLEGAPDASGYPSEVSALTFQTPVILDKFDYPILYYSANTRLYKKMKGSAPVAGYDDAAQDPAASGIYAHTDNALFTGIAGDSPTMNPWDFAGIGPAGHKLVEFGTWTNGLPDDPAEFDLPENTYTFPNYILNKDMFESTNHTGVVPNRPDSFLLITPGPDGIFGNGDDVTNY